MAKRKPTVQVDPAKYATISRLALERKLAGEPGSSVYAHVDAALTLYLQTLGQVVPPAPIKQAVKPAQKPQSEPKAPKPVVGAGMTVRSHEDVLREFGAPPPELDDVDFEDLRDEPVRSPGSGIWVHHYRMNHPNEGLHECDDADGVLRITVGKNAHVGAAVFRVPKGAGRAEWHFENHEGPQFLAGKEEDLSYEVEE